MAENIDRDELPQAVSSLRKGKDLGRLDHPDPCRGGSPIGSRSNAS